MRDLPQGMGSALAYHSCEEVAEPVDPETDALVANINAALVEPIFDSSTLRSESGKRMYIITASWIISGDV